MKKIFYSSLLTISLAGFTLTADAQVVTGDSTKTIKFNDERSSLFKWPPNSGLEPKILLDSIEMDYNSIQTLLPDNIRSIQVYKGETAIAKYGPTAINGLIVITTKKQYDLLNLKKQ